MNIFGVSVSEQNKQNNIAFVMKNVPDEETDPRCSVLLGTDLKQVGVLHRLETKDHSSDNRTVRP